MSSSPEPDVGDDELGPTARLWRRRSPESNAVGCAAALTGIDLDVLADALSISLAASAEAVELLDGMEYRVRTLTTSVESSLERCIYSVRGPVMWSETITARANALGNDDVYVCATPSRSFDTVENRVLVAALGAIGRATRALRGPIGQKVAPGEVDRIVRVADEARRWRDHPRLSEVRSTRLSGRDLARLRGGHRMASMGAVIAIRDRVAEPFLAEDLDSLADPWTRRYHLFVDRTLGALVERFEESEQLRYVDGGLWTGAASFRHPCAAGGTPAGLCYRGIPLLPAVADVEGAPWADRLPGDGVRITSAGDLRRLLDRLTAAPPIRRGRDGVDRSTSGLRPAAAWGNASLPTGDDRGTAMTVPPPDPSNEVQTSSSSSSSASR